jgi:hypothetical protein
MKVQLSPTVRVLANGASSDENRPTLSGVNFTKEEAIVADGFMLVIKRLPSPEMKLMEELPDDGIQSVIVPADALKACKGEKVELQTIECLREIASIELLKADATVSVNKIVARMTGGDFVVEADAIQGTYPDWSNLFTPSSIRAQIAVNTKILKKLLKTLPDDSMLRLRVSDSDKPIEFQCIDPDGDIPINGLVMPLNANWLDVQWRTKE